MEKNNMKLYLISQSENNDYDTYDSAVVCAKDENDAKTIHPNGCKDWHDDTWTSKGGNIEVKYIGKAAKGIERGLICASFNAG